MTSHLINPPTILVLPYESADPIVMQQMAHTTLDETTHSTAPPSPDDGMFTRRASVSLIAGYSIFSIALVLASPVMAQAVNVWLLWVGVGVMSIVTFGVGMLRGHTAERLNHPSLNAQSRRMQRWMKH
jgi:hypothetical protein